MNEVNDTDWVYDIETYLDLFSCGIVHVKTGTRFIFEVSDRINQSVEFVHFLYWLRNIDARLVGYNNLGFDWPVCDHLIRFFTKFGYFNTIDAKEKQRAILASQGSDRWAHMVRPSDIIVTQVDLYKIHHFDNMAKATSLKKLEINMRTSKVIDLPYDPDKPTTSAQKDEIIAYMCHDINETLRFYLYSLDQINFRGDLREKYMGESYGREQCMSGDVVNFNDTKIGKKFFEMKLEESGTPCYTKVTGRREPIQTIRDRINVGEVLSDKAVFKHPEFQRIRQWFSGQVLLPYNIKGFFKDVSATVDGFQYDFGAGGIHGYVHKKFVKESNDWEIWDWDVASYYPNIAITHGFYPDHLSSKFCDIYLDLFETRRKYAKGTAENAMYKLALNGVYGDSNNVYSPFYDPQYTMAITINGQLLLCVLAEWLTHEMETRSISQWVKMVQINTDGLTIKVHKDYVEWIHDMCDQWQDHTGMELESAQYKSMFIRDVNNYLAVKKNGGVKRIGAYAYNTPVSEKHTRERGWHQDHSMLVIRKAVEAFMVHGTPISDFIMKHEDPYDFQKSVKVPKSSRLQTSDGEIVQNTTRYFVSTDGVSLTKVMPPLPSKPENGERHFGVEAGWTVTVTNDMAAFDRSTINWYYYIEESKKLIIAEEMI